MNGITEGRVVHVVFDNGCHRAAIINHVINAETGDVGLSVFLSHDDPERQCVTFPQPINVMVLQSVPHDENGALHTWHWPERA